MPGTNDRKVPSAFETIDLDNDRIARRDCNSDLRSHRAGHVASKVVARGVAAHWLLGGRSKPRWAVSALLQPRIARSSKMAIRSAGGCRGRRCGPIRFMRAALIRSSSRSMATSVSNRWVLACSTFPSWMRNSRPASMAIRTIQITFNTACRTLSVHPFGSGNDSRSCSQSSSHMVSLGSFGKPSIIAACRHQNPTGTNDRRDRMKNCPCDVKCKRSALGEPRPSFVTLRIH